MKNSCVDTLYSIENYFKQHLSNLYLIIICFNKLILNETLMELINELEVFGYTAVLFKSTAKCFKICTLLYTYTTVQKFEVSDKKKRKKLINLN